MVQDVLESVGAGLDPRAVGGAAGAGARPDRRSPARSRIVLERHLEVAQPGDQACRPRAARAGRSDTRCRGRSRPAAAGRARRSGAARRRQSGQPREASDREHAVRRPCRASWTLGPPESQALSRRLAPGARLRRSGVVELAGDRAQDEAGRLGALAAELLALVLLERPHQVAEASGRASASARGRPPRTPPPAGDRRPGVVHRVALGRDPLRGTRPGRPRPPVRCWPSSAASHRAAAGPAAPACGGSCATGRRRRRARVAAAGIRLSRAARRDRQSDSRTLMWISSHQRPSRQIASRERPSSDEAALLVGADGPLVELEHGQRDPMQPERPEGVVEHQLGRLGAVARAPRVLLADRDVEERRAVVAVELAERAACRSAGPSSRIVDRHRQRIRAQRPAPGRSARSRRVASGASW